MGLDGAGRDRELALREAQPQRRVALGHDRGPPNNLEQLLARQQPEVVDLVERSVGNPTAPDADAKLAAEVAQWAQ